MSCCNTHSIESESCLIQGVEVKPLVTHADSRGFFREVIRSSDDLFKCESGEPFKQWSHSKMAKNTVKAWHFHHKQIDWWYVGIGAVRVVLIDNREESPTYREKLEIVLGDDHHEAIEAVVKIPQGVLHGGKVLTDFAHLFYITSEIYDTNDEGRIPFNDPEIGYDWGKEEDLIVANNDKKLFLPTYERVKLG